MLKPRPIKLLSARLANQIAAGEVIERPLSVVKELLENAIDAGAKTITVNIVRGGIDSITVSDDGFGIPKAELPLAICQHATSKISQEKDLEAIQTLGFRGEALASIAAISQLTLQSKTIEDNHAWQLTCNGNPEQYDITPVAHNQGTSITCQHIFFNTPARRKFLRTEQTEFNHIDQLFKRIALSHFNIHFKLIHNNKVMRDLEAIHHEEQQYKRVQKLLGKNFLDHAYNLHIQTHELTLKGWLCTQHNSSYQNDKQCFFLNNRLIKDKMVTHAIRQALGEHLLNHEYPSYVLYLAVPAKTIDVNVHPTKHEVRFSEPRLIHDFITKSIRTTLNEKPSDKLALNYHLSKQSNSWRAKEQSHIAYNQINNELNHSLKLHSKHLGNIIGLTQSNWLITEKDDGVHFISRQKLESYCIKEIWLDQLNTHAIKSTPLMLPLSQPTNIELTETLTDFLKNIGFVVNLSGPKILMLRAIPTCLKHFAKEHLLNTLLSMLKQAHSNEPKQFIELFLKELTFVSNDQPIESEQLHNCINILDKKAHISISQFGKFIPFDTLKIK